MGMPAAPREERRGSDGSDVLIFRALQVGDMLCAIPALRALRHRFPASTMTLVGLPWATQLLPRYASLIDHVLVFPGHPELPEQVADPAAADSFLCRVRMQRADLAIQLHGSGEISNRIVERFGARRMLAFSRHAVDADRQAYVRWPDRGHEVRRCLALADKLGADIADEVITFPVMPGDIAELTRTGLPAALSTRDYVCIHPGARSADRRWPPACFAQVADALAAIGFTVVLSGSGDEWPLAELVRQQMRYPALNAALPYSLGALAALLRDARLLICNDTGASHLAAALNTPSVVVFTGSDPERWAPLDHRRHCSIVDREGSRGSEVLRMAMCLLMPTAT